MTFTRQKEFEIRARYEFGENLKDLAIIYKIPLVTIKKRKKKSELKGDPWIKNSRSKDGYRKYINESDKKKAEIEENINEVARREIKQMDSYVSGAYYEKTKILDEELERAIKIRTKRIDMMMTLKKRIENIPLDLENKILLEKYELENRIKELEYEEKKRELDIKKEMMNL